MPSRADKAAFIFNLLRHVNSDRKVTPAARSVLFWLTHLLLDGDARECRPVTFKQIMAMAKLGYRTVARAIPNLENAGYLRTERSHRETNVYALLEREKWKAVGPHADLECQNGTPTPPLECQNGTLLSAKMALKPVDLECQNGTPLHLRESSLKNHSFCAIANATRSTDKKIEIEKAKEAAPGPGRPSQPPPTRGAAEASPEGSQTNVVPLAASPDRKPPAHSAVRRSKWASAPQGCRVPEDWKPTSVGMDYARKILGNEHARIAVDQFRDHWLAKAGPQALSADWEAQWRKWVRIAAGLKGIDIHRALNPSQPREKLP